MAKINKKIMDYIVLGASIVAGLGSAAYLSYDAINDGIISEKSVGVVGFGLGVVTAGMIYTGYRIIKEDFEKEKAKQENTTQENNLEREAKK